ncbi:MAG: hypothetical protein UT24_C0016G0021 [Candidatus Woesebacteria bacterium GW2011_GWB1_39_12]|uniref:Uncharacterized protein n=1 Tax=Candidatus Woesebacteria bacterium GW2011_GWB1_39_12 TaxID=1618574 RepID=A0A0G0QEK6_9BACT|nr:MAG: hypothetical protein UT24_C0016G0021 [Candidatus Woesebacteria bacterium GW2011_GWB1_39_12]
MTYSKTEREQYNEYRLAVCEKLSIRELDYNAFRRLGQKLCNIYVQSCNGEIDEIEYEQQVRPLYIKAEALARRLKLEIYFQTDPRGNTIYLSKEKIVDNDYTRNSISIY